MGVLLGLEEVDGESESEGCMDGKLLLDGFVVGILDGTEVGLKLGAVDGMLLGKSLGISDVEGGLDGWFEGTEEGRYDG